ncbi:MAG: hypothetical protein ACREOY_14915 [Candidatus Dormibacteraceae bacterium]
MNRALVVTVAAIGLAAVACGSPATAANTASPSPSSGRGGAQFRNNGASGQLVQVNGQTLILTGPSGDLTVSYSATTTFTRTSTAVLADIVPGVCILATGQKDAAGALTATTVRLSPKPAAGCAAAGRIGPNTSPPAGATPRPTASGQPAMAFISGEVSAAAGISITVLTTTSGSQTITVPTTAAVTTTVVAAPTDLRTGECLRATGARDAAGSVQATTITIMPAGPSGTCVTRIGGGGFGGRGGGRGGTTPPAAGG